MEWAIAYETGQFRWMATLTENRGAAQSCENDFFRRQLDFTTSGLNFPRGHNGITCFTVSFTCFSMLLFFFASLHSYQSNQQGGWPSWISQ